MTHSEQARCEEEHGADNTFLNAGFDYFFNIRSRSRIRRQGALSHGRAPRVSERSRKSGGFGGERCTY